METIRINIDKTCHYKINIDSNGYLTEKHLISFFSDAEKCTISHAIKKIMEKHSIDKNNLIHKIHRTKLNNKENYGNQK